jgi:hypothetical protein
MREVVEEREKLLWAFGAIADDPDFVHPFGRAYLAPKSLRHPFQDRVERPTQINADGSCDIMPNEVAIVLQLGCCPKEPRKS